MNAYLVHRIEYDSSFVALIVQCFGVEFLCCLHLMYVYLSACN